MIKKQFLFFILTFVTALSSFSLSEIEWIDVMLKDIVYNTKTEEFESAYCLHAVSEITNPKYPPSNLFDGDYSTTWVTGQDSKNNCADLFIALPLEWSSTLNVFFGFSINEEFYYKNSIPTKIKLTVFQGFNPEGHVGNNAVLFKLAKLPFSKIINIENNFKLTSIPLDFIKEKKLKREQKKNKATYLDQIKIPIASEYIILKLEILETKEGWKYDDICISELFFSKNRLK